MARRIDMGLYLLNIDASSLLKIGITLAIFSCSEKMFDINYWLIIRVIELHIIINQFA